MLQTPINNADRVHDWWATGFDEKEVNIRKKLARGKCTAVFFLQCLVAIGCHTLRLD